MKLDYKNISIHYTVSGEGSAVVLLHGFLESLNMWNALVPEILKEHQVVCIDLLGHGQTGCLGYIHTMEMMADAVEAVLKHLNIEESIFIGHSMGGYVALAFAEAFPDKIKGLCLMNSTPFPDSAERQANRDRAIKAVKHNPRNFISMSIANLFSPNNRVQFIEEIELIKLEAISLPVQGIVAALEGMKIRKDRHLVLQQLVIPKMVILGKRDPVLEYDILRPQMEELGVEIVVFPDGHMSHIENETEFTYKIKQFIEK